MENKNKIYISPRRVYVNDSVYYGSYYKNSNSPKYAPLYGLFCIKDGKLHGQTEASFTLNLSQDRVALLSLKDVQKDYKKAVAYAKKHKLKEKYFILRLSKKENHILIDNIRYSVRIDWAKRKYELFEVQDRLKYHIRNVPFFVTQCPYLKEMSKAIVVNEFIG